MKLVAKEQLTLSRRSFLVGSASGGLVMAFGLGGAGSAIAQIHDKSYSPTVWFEIGADGAVLVNIAKAEMGQHVGTALARVVADELGAAWSDVSIKHVDTDPRWGYMVTGGSWSVFTTFAQLSQAGAAGRIALCEAAAASLGGNAEDCSAGDSKITLGDQSLSFAELVKAGPIDRTFTSEELAALPIKAPADRTLIGKPVAAKDIPEKTRGAAVYGIDVERDGMVYGAPIIPPTRYGSTVRGVDDSAAKAIKGYQRYIQINDPSETLVGWIVAIANTFPAAMKAARALKVDWEAGDTAGVSEAQILDEGQNLAADASKGAWLVNEGDVAAARSDAKRTLNAVYRTATALHFPLEPMNAVAELVDGKWHIHAGNQWQSLIMPVLAKALEVPETDIVIHQYYLGGGFGRRLFGDYMLPAALAAKALGKPVKIVFPRDEDSRFDCVRSPSVQHFAASLNDDGDVTGIDHGAAAGWPTLTMAPGFMIDGINDTGKIDTFSISGADHWYTLANHRVRAINNELAQRTFLPGWLRAVGPGWIGWGVECFMDELAEAADADPIAFRLARLDAAGKNSGKPPESVGGASRLAAVLRSVRDRSGWDSADLPDNEAFGAAVCGGQERTMPTWVAAVVHVHVDPDSNRVTVRKIWMDIDCGTVVHPDGALAQAEGATLWGVSLALHEGTAIESGQVADRNLDRYTPLRFADVPELDIQFADSTEFPTGLGEPPLIVVAPAIGNAIYRATGKRVRDLPIRPAALG